MTASVSSPEDAVNLALARIGYKTRVTNLYEGSRAANAALNIYGQTRDEFLRQDDFGFAKRDVVMTLLKRAPPGGYVPPEVWNPATNPPLGWRFSYAYPPDCLKVRAIRKQAIFVLDVDPQPVVYVLENDNTYTPAQKVILCNVPNAVLTYTGQIVDLMK